jgi:hypothetical protein
MVVVRQEAALPNSCYIVRKPTARSMLQSKPATSNAVMAAWGAVIVRFHGVANLYKYYLWVSPLAEGLRPASEEGAY